MELADLQRAAARLATDAEARERLRNEGAGSLGLEAEAAAGLEEFARSLINKRLGEVRGLLPRTAAALGQEFGRRFRRFAASRPLAETQKHRRDALGFGEVLGEDASLEPWIKDLARYEAAWLRAWLRPGVFVRVFRHSVDRPGEESKSRRTAAVFLRWRGVPRCLFLRSPL